MNVREMSGTELMNLEEKVRELREEICAHLELDTIEISTLLEIADKITTFTIEEKAETVRTLTA